MKHPNQLGYYGSFGSAYIPEMLFPCYGVSRLGSNVLSVSDRIIETGTKNGMEY
jgi:hypothetical protein